MSFLLLIALILTGYLLGSVSSAIIIGNVFYDTDVREHGSGNAGFTNVVRVLGWKAGVPVFIFDVIKGTLAVLLAIIVNIAEPGTKELVNIQLLIGVAVLLGHIFPVYFNFKGGKGVATLLGLLVGIVPLPTLVCLGVFIVTLLITRYVSVSSMVAGITFPIAVIFIFNITIVSLVIFSIVVSVLLILTHQKNIVRLLHREESRVNFRRNRDKF